MSTKEILLVSETTVKERSNVDSNISGKLIYPAIRSSQESGLREILGSPLLDKIKDLVSEGNIQDPYKDLLIRCQDYLVYATVADLCLLTSVKISSAGLEQVSDERMNPISISDSYSVQSWYEKKRDFQARLIQDYLIKNQSKFPELCTGDCRDIRSNLYSAASSGLFLGGRRGKSPICPKFHLNYDKPSN